MAANNIHGKELVDEVTKAWEKLAKTISGTVDVVENYKKTTSKLPSDYLNNINKIKEAQDKQNTSTAAAIKIQTQLAAEEKESARQKNALVTANAKLNASTSKNAQELAKARFELAESNKRVKDAAILSSKLAGEYQKLAIKLKVVSTRIQDLNAKRLQGKKLTDKEQAELRQSIVLYAKYNTAIRGADASVGKFQRNVGNYPKAMGAAANAVRSLASAMGLIGGAFLFVQVMRDAFNTVREFDKQLIAVGKTANITGQELTNFGKDVIDLGLKLDGISIQGLLEASEVAGQLGIKGSSNILKFAKSVELLKLSAKGIGEESVAEFAKFIEVSKDSAKNADRLGSVVTELGNNFATTEKEVISSAVEIQKGVQLYEVSAEAVLGLAAATSTLGVQEQAARTSIRKTFGVLQQAIFTGKNLAEVLKLTGLTEKELAEQFNKDATGVFLKFLKGLKNINDEGGNTEEILEKLKLAGDRIAPTITSLAQKYELTADAVARANKEYVENTAALREAEAAAKSLDSLIGDLGDAWDGLVLSIDNGDGIFSRFTKGTLKFFTQGLLEARQAIGGFKLELSQIEAAAKKGVENALAIKKISATENNIEQIEKLIKTKEKELALENRQRAALITTAKLNGGITEEIQETIDAKRKDMATTRGQISAYKEFVESMKDAIKEEKKESEAIINNTEARKKSSKEIKENLKNSEDAFKSQIKTLQELKSKTEVGSTAWNIYNNLIKVLQTTLKGLKGELNDTKKAIGEVSMEFPDLQDNMEDAIETIEKLRKATEDWIDGFGSDFLASSGLSSLNTFFDGTFDKLMEGADTSAERFAVSFNAMAEVAQQTFAIIDNLSQQSFDSEYERLERQTELSLLFAGDNAEAREEIERQSEEKRREIAKREAEAQKKQAIFNVVVDTAQAIVATLARTPPPLGLPLAALMGTLGAVQLAAINSTPIPQFKDGVRGFDGGLAVVGDGGKHEYIKTPDGKVSKTPKTDTLVNLPKGTDVYKDKTDFDKELANMLGFNGIFKDRSNVPNIDIENSGLSKADLQEVIGGLERTIKSQNGYEINYNENGVEKYIKRGQAKTKVLNNVLRIKGRNV